MQIPNDRTQAAEKGLTYYFTAKPCKYSHIALRRTDTGVCVECKKLTNKRQRQRILDLLAQANGR
jgi:hypothetical protein